MERGIDPRKKPWSIAARTVVTARTRQTGMTQASFSIGAREQGKRL